MGKFIYISERPVQRIYVPVHKRRKYGFFKFVLDCTMTVFTGGLWLIWVFVREMRAR